MELLLFKNKEYIKAKTDTVDEELKFLDKMTGSTSIVSLGSYGKNEIINIKKYQLKILEWLNEANIVQIKQIYDNEKKLLCISCQGGLHHGELKCVNCAKRFIFCDMMRRSLR